MHGFIIDSILLHLLCSTAHLGTKRFQGAPMLCSGGGGGRCATSDHLVGLHSSMRGTWCLSGGYSGQITGLHITFCQREPLCRHDQRSKRSEHVARLVLRSCPYYMKFDYVACKASWATQGTAFMIDSNDQTPRVVGIGSTVFRIITADPLAP